MQITGTRPVKVTALPPLSWPAGLLLPDSPSPDYIKASSPSLIQMDNGAIVRILVGGMTGDSHMRRLWGTMLLQRENPAKQRSQTLQVKSVSMA